MSQYNPIFTANAWGSNRLDLFALGLRSTELYHLAWAGTGWQTVWEPLGGIFNTVIGVSTNYSSPAVASGQPDRLDVFCVGAGEVGASPGTLQHLAWMGNATGWQSAWEDIAVGPAGFGAPLGVLAWAWNKLEVFSGPTTVDQVPVIHQTSWTGSGWVKRSPIAIPSTTTGLGPAVAVCSVPQGSPAGAPASRLDLFAVGVDGTMYHCSADDAVAWSAWDNLGQPTIGALIVVPAAVSWAPGRLDVFAIGGLSTVGATMFHKAWQNGWTDWETLPFATPVLSAPVVVSWGANRLDVFAVDTNENLQQMTWDGSQSSHWLVGNNFGFVGSAPVALSWGVGRIDLFTMPSQDAGNIQHIAYDAAFGNKWQTQWESLPGMASASASSGPAANGAPGTFPVGFASSTNHA
jgi:hypothetical protein